ncbi:MAG: sigma 54-dependent Fis family transcriptional regulator [Deltaproteobacteria bacterium]|nr:sigma 54-dependent Fis family transcriptional regulator [Deltaproteobacteria bacterium]
MKVNPQGLLDPTELEAGVLPRVGLRPRPGSPLRFTPLTGVITTDLAGGIVVRRVRVRVTLGPDRGREAMLEAGTLLVGTHADNDLILRDPQVGKYHLEIALVAGGVRVRDLGSENGTHIAGGRVSTSVVGVGTEVTVGRSVLQLLAGDLVVPFAPSERVSFGPVLGASAPMRQLFALLERVAPTDAPILLEGEPGSGRTLVAKAIHAASRFAASPVVVLDLRLPPSERPSLSATAQRGDTFTLLLERIDAATSADVQGLLTLYERREEGVLDARIVATASTDLRAMAPDDRLRQELLAHVTAVRLVVPPLAARREDVPSLVAQFARECCGAEVRFGPGDLDPLMTRDFPGNVRELKQLVQAALHGEVVPTVLPRAGVARARAALLMPLNSRPKPPNPKVARDRLVEHFERDRLQLLLQRHKGDSAEVARALAMPRKELVKLLKKYGLA